MTVDVQMIKQTFWGNLEYPPRSMFPGDIVRVPEDVAARWIKRGIAAAAVKTREEPAEETIQAPMPGVRGLLREQEED